mmetsp:Transcript_25686/g.69936  ORF Transcript_25686/g.69936 Transcript_25686/m.69936 type:complete len:213 (-) Transcript_25686:240-878(-)
MEAWTHGCTDAWTHGCLAHLQARCVVELLEDVEGVAHDPAGPEDEGEATARPVDGQRRDLRAEAAGGEGGPARRREGVAKGGHAGEDDEEDSEACSRKVHQEAHPQQTQGATQALEDTQERALHVPLGPHPLPPRRLLRLCLAPRTLGGAQERRRLRAPPLLGPVPVAARPVARPAERRQVHPTSRVCGRVALAVAAGERGVLRRRLLLLLR